MKRGRRSYDEQATARLLELWEPESDFGAPLGCVATTYTFDAGFFEEECLARFTQMNGAPMEDAKSYVIEREERLSQVFACVIVDRGHVSTQRSLRWHVLPASVPRGGRFHAKLSLLVWQDAVRVLVSSANLTEAGYRKNYECMSVIEFRPESELPLSLLRDVIAFLQDAREYVRFPADQPGPHRSLASFLESTAARVAAWSDRGWRRGEPRAVFLPVRPGQASLFAQLAEHWRGAKPNEAWVLSPYYDKDDRARSVLEALDDMMVRRSRVIEFVARGQYTSETSVDIELPESLKAPTSRSAEHKFHIVDPGEGEEHRELHAKELYLRRDNQALFMFGSSNFTAPGTGLSSPTNVEANVAYLMPRADAPFAKTCDHATPPSLHIDLDEDTVRFLSAPDSQTPEPDTFSLLPMAFEAALFRPADDGGVLVLSFAGQPPDGFRVVADPGEPMLDAATWQRQGSPETIELAWARPRPPSHLIVHWHDGDEAHQAIWVVNVTDTSKLPPPEELRSLTLDELLEVLSSARPLHQAVARLLQRRKSREKGAAGRAETDPHKKVETRNFLLRRMRRIAGALEGMRERLERPAATVEALRWRLHGPIGPVSVARRLAAEEGKGAAFFIAEVALTVSRAEIPSIGQVDDALVRTERAEVIAELRAMADAHDAPVNLAKYVRTSFKEIRR